MSDVLLIQAARGPEIPVLETTRDWHDRYCRTHSIDYLCHLGPSQIERQSRWDRIDLVKRALIGSVSGIIVWVAPDCLIANPTVDLRDALPNDKWIGLVKRAPWYDTSVFFVRKCGAAVDLFTRAWEVDAGSDPKPDLEALRFAWAQKPDRAGLANLDKSWCYPVHDGTEESAGTVIRSWSDLEGQWAQQQIELFSELKKL